MKKLATFSFHHDSEKSSYKMFVSSDAEAFKEALMNEWGLMARKPIEKLLEQAPKKKQNGLKFRVCTDTDDPLEEDCDAVVWDCVDDGKRNFGVGIGSSINTTDKRDNVWIEVVDWVPNQERQSELESLSKEELIQQLLELEAIR